MHALSESPPPEPFWSEFTRTCWETRSGAFPGAAAHPHVTPGELFAALVTASTRFRAGDGGVSLCLWVEGRKEEGRELMPLLPCAEDGSLEGYHARLEARLGGCDYTLLLADAHLYSEPLWRMARRVLHRLCPHTGLPSGWVDTAVFVGRYQRTPFGVHEGPMSVMTFPVVGRKRFRLWSSAYLQRHPELADRLRYEEHLAESWTLEGAPGDMLYWPAHDWHIAEGDGSFTAAWNLGFWMNRREPYPLRHVLGQLRDALAAAPPPEHDATRYPFEPTREAPGALPRSWRHHANTLHALCTEGGLERLMTAAWMKMASAYGFKHIPEPTPPVALAREDVLAAVPESPLLLQEVGGGELYLAACGHVLTLPALPGLLEALRRLRAGARPRVGELLAACVGTVRVGEVEMTASPEEVLGLLSQLVRLRALRLTDPEEEEV